MGTVALTGQRLYSHNAASAALLLGAVECAHLAESRMDAQLTPGVLYVYLKIEIHAWAQGYV
jgi:hypothetical protein